MTTFNRAELLETLSQCRLALGTDVTIPELGHFWFNGKSVYAYTGKHLGVRHALPSELACGIPGRPLVDLLKTSSLKSVSLDQTKGGVVLQMGKQKVPLATLPIDRLVWPFPKVLPKKGGLVLSDGLLDAFTRLQFVKLSKQTLTIHHGVLVQVGHEAINCYATDSYSVAQEIIKTRSVSMPEFILSWDMVTALCTMLAGQSGPKLWLLNDCIVAGRAGVTIASSLLETHSPSGEKQIPDLPKVMKDRFNGKLQELPKGFAITLERAAILAGASEPTVKTSIDKGVMSLHGKWAIGAVNESIELSGRVESVPETRFQANLISRALKLSDRFSLTERNLALAGGDNFRYLLSAKHDPK